MPEFGPFPSRLWLCTTPAFGLACGLQAAIRFSSMEYDKAAFISDVCSALSGVIGNTSMGVFLAIVLTLCWGGVQVRNRWRRRRSG